MPPTTGRPGEWVDTGTHLSDIDFAEYPMRISTDRYTSPEIARLERSRIWMKVWQVAGRAVELVGPEVIGTDEACRTGATALSSRAQLVPAVAAGIDESVYLPIAASDDHEGLVEQQVLHPVARLG